MKRLVIIVMGLFCFAAVKVANKELIKLRELYYRAAKDKDYVDLFREATEKNTAINASVLKGYEGMCWMIKANHSYNPYNKLSYFYKGKDLLELAIKEDSLNMELRFLRFGVQTNAPGFLSYRGQIQNDKNLILSSYSRSDDRDLRKRVKEYMMESKYCDQNDKKKLE